MRPYLAFVSGVAGLVGLAFIENVSTQKVILGFVPLFFSYGFGQALTDCFQIDTDAISSPYRPLTRGVISRKQVLAVSLAGLLASASVMAYLNLKILFLGLLAVLGLLTYTKLKRTWWGGPPWNSWIVALLPVMGRLVDKGYRIPETVHSIPFRSAILTIFFGYANFVLTGYFKDISADRQTNYRTFPVVFGWHKGAIVSDLLAAVTAFFAATTLFSIRALNLLAGALFVAACVLSLYAQIKIHRIKEERETFGPITNVVRVLILFAAAVILTLRPAWLIFMTAFYLLFELSLRLRPEQTQV